MPAKSKPRSSSIASALMIGAVAIVGSRVDASPLDPLDGTLRIAQASVAAEGDTELLLEIDVNAQPQRETALVLRRADGTFWLSSDTFDRFRLRKPAGASHALHGTTYLPLASITGVRYTFDPAAASLAITTPPEAFESTTFATGTRAYPPPVLPSPGGFLNYNVLASHASGQSSVAGEFEAGVFGPLGVLTSGLLAQSGSDANQAVRLDTTYTRDFPQRMETLRIGDTITFAGAWGRAVRIGGVQYGTNFATQPGFITFPTVFANGQAALPSTVDVFVNNALVAQRPVPPGPFSITNIPTVSGSGNVQLVVRDLLGREQVISQPFYSTAQLLAPGLAQYSIEAGFERNDFGIESANYGKPIASATYRRGMTPTLTAEARGEATRHGGAIGAAADWLADDIGVLRAIAAASDDRHDGGGALVAAGFERRTGIWSASLQAQWSSPAFRIAGVSADNPLPRLQASATVGLQLGRYGSIGVTWIEQNFRASDDIRVLSVGYTASLGSIGFLNLSAVKTYGHGGDLALGATITIPLTSRDWASVAQNAVRASTLGNRDDTTVTLQRNLPAGEGFGYRVLARTHSEVQAGVAYQNDVGTYTLEATRLQGENAARAGVAGGFGFLGGYAFASREITESFGIVRVDDYDGVGVTLDNQAIARTGAGGYAVVPRLRAYDVNPISIVQQDLPLDAKVERLAVDAVPYYRSGVLVDLPIRRSHGATLRVRLDDGGDLPAGATVDVIGGEGGFPVALEGEVYMTGLRAQNRLRANWSGASCEFDVAMPATRDPLPDLGTALCHGVAR